MDTQNLAPIGIFVYKRPEHTRRTVEALAKNDLASDSDVFIFSDGHKNEKDAQGVNDVRAYIHTLSNKGLFKSVTLIESEKNNGLHDSLIAGVSKLMNEYGKAIIVEDDIETSPDFLRFMNGALDYYREDEKIWSVSGNSFCSRAVEKSKNDVLWSYRGDCWGWGSWKDRWDKVDWDISNYDNFIKDKKAQKIFNRGGRDLTMLLQKQINGEIDSWAIIWVFQEYLESMISIAPRNAKVRNIGLDGSGTHRSKNALKQKDFIVEDNWEFDYDLSDKALLRSWNRYFMRSFYRQMIGSIVHRK